MNWEYLNLQFKTVPAFGVWSKISDEDLNKLKSLQDQDWEVYQIVNIRGSLGFTSHVLFLLRKEKK